MMLKNQLSVLSTFKRTYVKKNEWKHVELLHQTPSLGEARHVTHTLARVQEQCVRCFKPTRISSWVQDEGGRDGEANTLAF